MIPQLHLMTCMEPHTYPRTIWLGRADLMISEVIGQDEESAGSTFLIITLREGAEQSAMFSWHFSLEEPRMNWTVPKEKECIGEESCLVSEPTFPSQNSVTSCLNNL